MLDARMIFRCHMAVPVWCWPVLWVYLRRLEAAAALARAEGRKGFMWHLMPNGVIWISHVDASAAERAARGELPTGFDRAPWVRLSLAGPEAVWQSGCDRTGTGLVSDCFWHATGIPPAWFRHVTGMPSEPARAPP